MSILNTLKGTFVAMGGKVAYDFAAQAARSTFGHSNIIVRGLSYIYIPTTAITAGTVFLRSAPEFLNSSGCTQVADQLNHLRSGIGWGLRETAVLTTYPLTTSVEVVTKNVLLPMSDRIGYSLGYNGLDIIWSLVQPILRGGKDSVTHNVQNLFPNSTPSTPEGLVELATPYMNKTSIWFQNQTTVGFDWVKNQTMSLLSKKGSELFNDSLENKMEESITQITDYVGKGLDFTKNMAGETLGQIKDFSNSISLPSASTAAIVGVSALGLLGAAYFFYHRNSLKERPAQQVVEIKLTEKDQKPELVFKPNLPPKS